MTLPRTSLPNDALPALFDQLLPGGRDWPPASRAIPDLDDVVGALTPMDRNWLADLARDVRGVPPGERPQAIEAAEQARPDAFGRLLQALYDAYYNSDEPLRAVRRLAEAAPREPSPHFDPTLLDRVIATDAGRRRL